MCYIIAYRYFSNLELALSIILKKRCLYESQMLY